MGKQKILPTLFLVCLLCIQTTCVFQDIVFIVNIYDELPTTEADAVIDTIIDIVSFLNIGPSDALISLIYAADIATSTNEIIKFSDYEIKENVTKALETFKPIDTSRYPSSLTNTALFRASWILDHNQGLGARENATKIVILFAGVPSSSALQTVGTATAYIHNQGTELYTVGFGEFFQDENNDELLRMTTNETTHYYLKKDYTELCDVVPSLVRKLDGNTAVTDSDGCPATSSTTASSIKSTNVALIVGVVVGIVLVLVIGSVAARLVCTKKYNSKIKPSSDVSDTDIRLNSISRDSTDSQMSRNSVNVSIGASSMNESGYISPNNSELPNISSPNLIHEIPNEVVKISKDICPEKMAIKTDTLVRGNTSKSLDHKETNDENKLEEHDISRTDSAAKSVGQLKHFHSNRIDQDLILNVDSYAEKNEEYDKSRVHTKHVHLREPNIERAQTSHSRSTKHLIRRDSVISSIWKNGNGGKVLRRHHSLTSFNIDHPVVIKEKVRTPLWESRPSSGLAEKVIQRKEESRETNRQQLKNRIELLKLKSFSRKHASSTFENSLFANNCENENSIPPISTFKT